MSSHFIKSIFGFVLLLLTMPLVSQTVWDGGAGTTSWHDADNWSTNTIPTVLNDVEINAGDQVVLNSDGFANSINVKGSLRLGAGQLLYVSGSSSFGYRNDGGNTEILGTLLIDQTNVQGFINRATGTVTVEGSITVKDQIGTIPVHNFGGGSLTVTATGSISLGNCSGNGITNNGATTSFVNEGTIHFIHGIGGDGIYNGAGASFELKSTGDILIKEIGNIGIVNTGAGSSFVNEGDLQMTNMDSDVCLKNLVGASFENAACGIFNIQDSIYNEGMWDNSAYVVNTFDRKMESSGTMTNSGLIQDIENSFENLITNSGYIVTRTTAPFTENYSDAGLVHNAGGPNTVIFANQIYHDQSLTQPAGSFNPSTLEWTPTDAYQTTLFFIQANITGQSCPLTVELQTSAFVYPENQRIVWVGNKGDWDVALNWNYERVPLATDTILIPNESDSVRINTGLTSVGAQLENNGVLRIETGGSLEIDGSLSDGIKNNNVIENYGSISVENTGGNGIVNNDTIYNYASIHLPQRYVWSGVGNDGYFFNGPAASLTVESSDRYGITNTGNGSTLDNEGVITIEGSFGDYTLWNVNNSVINNLEGGHIYLNGSGGNGLFQSINSTLTNDGAIHISDNFTSTGITNNEDCTIINNACGSIYIQSIISSGLGIIENYGLISQDFDGVNHEDGISNYGFIEDMKNSFADLANNDGYIAKPVFGSFHHAKPIHDVLDFDIDVPNTIIDCEWYIDPELTVAAGMFVEALNTWTPNENCVGKDTFYFKISTMTPGCHDTVSITFDEMIIFNPVCGTNVTWMGNSGAWEDPKNWDLGRVPGICDTIIILNTTDTLTLSQNIPAYATKIKSKGSIIVKIGDSLTVSGSNTDNISMQDGTIYNNGYLESSGSIGNCIDSDSDIENNGEIVLSDCYRGINGWNTTIENQSGAQLKISNIAENAIHMYLGELRNSGTLEIGKQVTGSGIKLEAAAFISNYTMATLMIQKTDIAIDILSPSVVFNFGTIKIDTTRIGVANSGSFLNKGGSKLFITQTSEDAFSNPGSIINNDEITISDGVLGNGISNSGSVVNHIGAHINIKDTSQSGIANNPWSSLQNFGTINTGINILGSAISLTNASLTNESTGDIELKKSLQTTLLNVDSNITLKGNSDFVILEN